MIKGTCKVIAKRNVDTYKISVFPEVFCAVPRKGELVEATNGRKLKVHMVIHRTMTNFGDEPRIMVELTDI